MKNLFFTCTVALLSLPIMAQIDKLGWHPDTKISLGKGITKSFPLAQHFDCLDTSNAVYRSLDHIGRSESVTTNMKIQIVTDNRELDSILGISGSLAAHTSFGVLEKFDMPAIRLGAGYGKRDTLKENSVALVITVEADYGRYEMKQRNGDDLELKQKYQALLDSKQYDLFVKQCGTHVVTQENRKGLVSAVIKVSNLTKEKKNQLAASLQLSSTLNQYQAPPSNSGMDRFGRPGRDFDDQNDPNAQQGPGGNHDPLYFDSYKNARQGVSIGGQFLKTAMDLKGNIEISMVTRGGGGLGAQSKIFELASATGSDGTPTFAGLMATIDFYLQSFKVISKDIGTSGESAPAEAPNYDVLPGAPADYLLTSYELYGLPTSKAREVVNNPMLEEIYYLYVAALGKYETILKELDKVDDSLEGSEPVEKLMQAKIKYEQFIRALWDNAKNILDKNESNDPTYETLPAKPKVNYEELVLGAAVTKAAMVCEANGTYYCGIKASLWQQGGMSLWKTHFQIEGKISAPQLLQTLILKQVDPISGVATQQLISLHPGDNLGFAFLGSDGKFLMNFSPLEQLKSKNQEQYVQYRQRMARFEIILVDKEGTEKKIPVTNVVLEGRHLTAEQMSKAK